MRLPGTPTRPGSRVSHRRHGAPRVHLPTAVRTGVLSAATTFLLFVVVQILGPALAQALGDGFTAALVVLAGSVARVAVGRSASAVGWREGVEPGEVWAGVALGGLAGWAVFPGALSALGLAVSGAGPSGWLSLAGSLALWLVALLAGAALGRSPSRWRRRSPRSGQAGAEASRRRWTAPASGPARPPWR